MIKFKKLKVAIGISGRIIFLQKFPNNKLHNGLNEQLEEMESEITFSKKPGLYMAEFGFEMITDYNGEVDTYFDIIRLEPIR